MVQRVYRLAKSQKLKIRRPLSQNKELSEKPKPYRQFYHFQPSQCMMMRFCCADLLFLPGYLVFIQSSLASWSLLSLLVHLTKQYASDILLISVRIGIFGFDLKAASCGQWNTDIRFGLCSCASLFPNILPSVWKMVRFIDRLRKEGTYQLLEATVIFPKWELNSCLSHKVGQFGSLSPPHFFLIGVNLKDTCAG